MSLNPKTLAEKLERECGVRFPLGYCQAWKYRGVGRKTLEAWVKMGLIHDGLSGLSTRAVKCLSHAGLLSRASVRSAIENRKLYPESIRNYGIKTHAEVCQFAGIDPSEYRDPPKRCPHCGELIP